MRWSALLNPDHDLPHVRSNISLMNPHTLGYGSIEISQCQHTISPMNCCTTRLLGPMILSHTDTGPIPVEIKYIHFFLNIWSLLRIGEPESVLMSRPFSGTTMIGNMFPGHMYYRYFIELSVVGVHFEDIPI